MVIDSPGGTHCIYGICKSLLGVYASSVFLERSIVLSSTPGAGFPHTRSIFSPAEPNRIDALKKLGMLDTPREELFDKAGPPRAFWRFLAMVG